MIQITSTNGVHHATDEAIDSLYAWMPGIAPAPAPCPEAIFSLTLKGTLDGQEALLTARGQTPDEFTRNLQAIRGLLDAKAQTPAQPLSPQQHNAAQVHRPITGFCAVHNMPMQENEKNGQRWWSHRLPEGQWCKGK